MEFKSMQFLRGRRTQVRETGEGYEDVYQFVRKYRDPYRAEQFEIRGVYRTVGEANAAVPLSLGVLRTRMFLGFGESIPKIRRRKLPLDLIKQIYAELKKNALTTWNKR